MPFFEDRSPTKRVELLLFARLPDLHSPAQPVISKNSLDYSIRQVQLRSLLEHVPLQYNRRQQSK